VFLPLPTSICFSSSFSSCTPFFLSPKIYSLSFSLSLFQYIFSTLYGVSTTCASTLFLHPFDPCIFTKGTHLIANDRARIPEPTVQLRILKDTTIAGDTNRVQVSQLTKYVSKRCDCTIPPPRLPTPKGVK
jgi:hypothetical protein